MNKKMMMLPIVLLGFGLAACEGEEQETVIETEEVTDESVAEDQESQDPIEEEPQDENAEEELVNEAEENYQSLLDQAKREYEAEQLDAAAGTLSVLLQNDLTDHEAIKTEAENLKEEIHVLQAENAREVAGAYSEDSTYQDERQSAILAEEYLESTGLSIEEATDEELMEWFIQREADGDQAEEAEEWTKEEAENYAFDQLLLLEDLNYEAYIFFVNLMEDDWVQLEVREPVEQDGVTWSNLIGLYRFNVSTDELLKLDIVTGEYQPAS